MGQEKKKKKVSDQLRDCSGTHKTATLLTCRQHQHINRPAAIAERLNRNHKEQVEKTPPIRHPHVSLDVDGDAEAEAGFCAGESTGGTPG